jgi:hypothetical protein
MATRPLKVTSIRRVRSYGGFLVSELKDADKTYLTWRLLLMIAGSAGAFISTWYIVLGHYHFVLFLALSSYVYGENRIARRLALGIKNDPLKYFFSCKFNIVFHTILAVFGIVLGIYELLNK